MLGQYSGAIAATQLQQDEKIAAHGTSYDAEAEENHTCFFPDISLTRLDGRTKAEPVWSPVAVVMRQPPLPRYHLSISVFSALRKGRPFKFHTHLAAAYSVTDLVVSFL